MNRRAFLMGVGGTVALGLAGCLGDGGLTTEPTFELRVQVSNDHDRAYGVEITTTNADDEVVFQESFEVQPNTGRSYSEDLPAGEYVTVVELTDRSETTARWDTDQCDVSRVEVRIDRDGRLASHVTCADRTTTTAN